MTTFSRLLAAVGHERRARLLELLAERDGQTQVELVEAMVSTPQPSLLHHLHVLEQAGMVRSFRVGRTRRYELQPAAFLAIRGWLRPFLMQLPERLAEPGSRRLRSSRARLVVRSHIRAYPSVVFAMLFGDALSTQIWPGRSLVLLPQQRMMLRDADGTDEVEMRLTRLDLPWRADLTWRMLTGEGAGEGESRVLVEIADLGGITRVTVRHLDLAGRPVTYRTMAQGWRFTLDRLKTLLETGKPLVPASRDRHGRRHIDGLLGSVDAARLDREVRAAARRRRMGRRGQAPVPLTPGSGIMPP